MTSAESVPARSLRQLTRSKRGIDHINLLWWSHGCLHSLVRTVASVAKHEIMAASQPLNAPKEGCKQGRIQGGRMRGCVSHQRLVADWYFRIFATFMRNVACKNWQSSTKKMYSSSPNLLPVPWPRWELRTQTQSSLTDNFWICH